MARVLKRNLYVESTKNDISIIGRVREGYFGIALSVYIRRQFPNCPGMDYNIIFPDELIYNSSQKEIQSLRFTDPELGDEVIAEGKVIGTLDFVEGAWTISYKEE